MLCQRLSSIMTLPIPWSHFNVPPKPNAHPTSRFFEAMHHNLATLTVDHKNKRESIGLMDNYYVVGVIGIPYSGCGVIINIVYERITSTVSQLVTSCIAHAWISRNCPLKPWERKANGCIINIYTMYLDLCARLTTKMTSSSMLLHSLSTKLCNHSNLSVL